MSIVECLLIFVKFLNRQNRDKMGILEKISEIEKEISRTQKNKGIKI